MLRILLFLLSAQLLAQCQGYLLFNNRVTGPLDRPIFRGPTLPFAGQGAGPGFSAQLYLVHPDGALQPLEPATTFRTGSPATWPFLVEVNVQVPGVAPLEWAVFRVRAFETRAGSYEAAIAMGLAAGESPNTGLVQVGTEQVPGILHTLDSFTVDVVPEPGTMSLVFLGAIGFVVLAKRKRS